MNLTLSYHRFWCCQASTSIFGSFFLIRKITDYLESLCDGWLVRFQPLLIPLVCYFAISSKSRRWGINFWNESYGMALASKWRLDAFKFQKFPLSKQGKNKNQKTNNFVNLQVGINICSYETELGNDLLYSITIPAQQGNLF